MKLDINKGSSDKIIAFENDNLLKNENITLMQDGSIVDLTGLTCDMAYVDINNGNGDIIESLNISNPTNGEIELPINSNLTKKDGIYDCELRLKSSNGYVKFTAFFSLIIKANVFNKIGNKILSNDSFSKIEEILKQADGYKQELDKKIAAINLSITTGDNLNTKLVNNTNTANTTNTTLESNIEEGNKTNEDSITKDTALKETIKKAETINVELVGNENQATLNEEARKKNEAERVEAEKIREEKITEFGSQVTKNTNDIAQNRKDIERSFETINDNSFLLFSGQDVTVEHSKIGFTKGLKAEGMTYQNLAISKKVTVEASRINMTIDNKLLKSNTTYSTNLPKACQYGVANSDGSWKRNAYVNSKLEIILGENEKIYNIFLAFSDGYKESDKIHLDNSIILEGSNITIPNTYFEGIKSVGETEGKISILSHGKNLFNVSFEKGKAINSDNGSIYSQSNRDLSDFQKVPSNTQIVLSGGAFGGRCLFNKNKEFIKSVTTNNFTTTNDTCYIRLAVDNSQNYNIQIEKGTVKTPYEPYKEDKKEILLPYQYGFKGFLNGAKDTLEERQDGIYIVQRVGRELLDNTKDWKIGDLNSYGVRNFTLVNPKKGDTIICDKLKIQSTLLSETTDEGIFANNTHTFIRKLNSNFDTIEKFKNWIRDNPVTIYYELVEPIEYKISNINSIELETFKDVTYTDSKPHLTFKAPVDVPATISSLKSKNTMLMVQNTDLQNKNIELEEVNKKQNEALKDISSTTDFLIEDALTRKLNN